MTKFAVSRSTGPAIGVAPSNAPDVGDFLEAGKQVIADRIRKLPAVVKEYHVKSDPVLLRALMMTAADLARTMTGTPPAQRVEVALKIGIKKESLIAALDSHSGYLLEMTHDRFGLRGSDVELFADLVAAGEGNLGATANGHMLIDDEWAGWVAGAGSQVRK